MNSKTENNNISLDGLLPELWVLQDFYEEVMADLYYRHHVGSNLTHDNDNCEKFTEPFDVCGNNKDINTRRSRIF